jgi:RNase adapter protein RapZ
MTTLPRPPKSILIVTGLSGAGKSTALKTLEDAGWETVDNLPLLLVDRLLAAPTPEGRDPMEDRPLAVGIDARTRGFDAEAILQRIEGLRARRSAPVEMLFLDCSGSVLERRYAETRRRHPLALDRPAADGIAQERELLEPLRQAADHLIDTSDYAANALQQAIRQRFSGSAEATLTLLSFGFARGVPRNADLVFDMRFLQNPFWDAALRPMTGLDEPVRAHVSADPLFETVVSQIETLLKTVLPRYNEDGKSYVTVAFGCTGGRHRSVCVTEEIGKRLRAAGFSPTISHRNLESAPLDAYETRRRDDSMAIQERDASQS